eukprot:931128-Amphidinium_carterae.1
MLGRRGSPQHLLDFQHTCTGNLTILTLVALIPSLVKKSLQVPGDEHAARNAVHTCYGSCRDMTRAHTHTQTQDKW